MSAVDETRSAFEAVQKFVGLRWSRLIALVGPAVACLWVYGAVGLSDQRGALAAPLDVLSSLAAHFNVQFNWPDNAAAWLEAHDGIYLPTLVVAIVLACLAAAPSEASGPWLSLSTLMLLTAVQMRGLAPIVVFGAVTILVMGIAVVLDRQADRSFNSRWISIPGLSFQRWVMGPGAVVGLPLFLPFLIVAGMVEAFRIERAPMPPATGAAPSSSSPTLCRECAQRDGQSAYIHEGGRRLTAAAVTAGDGDHDSSR